MRLIALVGTIGILDKAHLQALVTLIEGTEKKLCNYQPDKKYQSWFEKKLVLIKFKTYIVYAHDDNHNSGLSLKQKIHPADSTWIVH